jgi:DNA invertase Pin-like site-specific DNA recombinase
MGQLIDLAEARQKKKRGRPRVLDAQRAAEGRALLRQGMRAVDVAEALQVSRATVYRRCGVKGRS